jgi:spore germination cell wall hydrolase CwlJ-like protein
MRFGSRAAVSAASFFCALSMAAVSAPSLALDSDSGMGSATAMLAAVTAPLLAVDAKTLAAHAASDSTDFSTNAAEAGSDTAPQSLADLVEANSDSTVASEDERCLATSVYFESKGEPLNGQLAVAQTIINRSKSGRFPESVCDVVRQPGQFSFLRRGEMPEASTESSAWHRAVAVAKIARDGLWKEVAPAALYFHARRVSPGWGKVRVASIGNHIFFR